MHQPTIFAGPPVYAGPLQKRIDGRATARFSFRGDHIPAPMHPGFGSRPRYANLSLSYQYASDYANVPEEKHNHFPEKDTINEDHFRAR
jgi:hypothetical protein